MAAVAERRLPIPAAQREFTVKVNGETVPRTHQLVALTINATVNRIASARLVYLDGAASRGDFPLSSDDLFAPGAKVEIAAGAGRDVQALFEGVVVAHAIKLRDRVSPHLVVECRHAAAKLAQTRRGRNHRDVRDSDVVEQLLQGAGVAVEVESTSLRHEQLVQFDATDWDFALRRAQAVGLAVFTRAAKLVARKPTAAGDAIATLAYGATLIELDAQSDAREQAGEHHALAWNAADQALVDSTANDPAFTAPGNFDAGALADAVATARRDLRHAALPEAEAQAWADAAALRARVNQAEGRAKCEGIGSVFPGDVVQLAGCGARFNGKVLVTGVRHAFDTVEGWKTHLQFGGIEAAELRTAEQPPRPAGGLFNAVAGLQIGIVTSNEDPAGEDRVRIKLPLVDGGDDGVWARVASLDAGKDRGFFIRPEIGDEVVLGFIENDPRHPVILGMLHSSAKPAPARGSDDNHEKLYKSRSGLRVVFDDDKKIVTIDTPAGQKLVLDDDAKSVTLADANGNKLVMDSSGIALESAKALQLKGGTDAKVEAGTGVELKAGAQFKLSGSAGLELSSSGVTKIAGSLVQIN
jgi:Rhs element Vgr protein